MDKRLRNISVIFIIFFALSSCSTKSVQVEPVDSKDASAALPFASVATFTGAIPCEDCVQVDITLNIYPDSMYQLRKTYRTKEGPAKIESQIGKWKYLPEDKLLILGKEQGLLKTYLVASNDKLQFIEWEGADNAQQIQYELVRSLDIDPFEDIVKITGDFTAIGGVGSIRECSAGLTLPVSSEKDYRTLLQSYMNTPHEKDQPLLASVLGKIVRGEDGRSQLIIEHFNTIYPDRNCEGEKIKTSLTGTYWRLLEVDGTAVTRAIDEKQAYLLLNSDRTFRAYGNCNKISGSYLAKGDLLMIKRKPSIRMACPNGVVMENKLIEVLAGAKSFRIDGEILELLDQNRQVRARFQAGT